MDDGPRGGVDAPVSCYAHESGTTCRLLTAVLAAGSGLFRMHGVERLHQRPIGELGTALRELASFMRKRKTILRSLSRPGDWPQNGP